MEVKNYTRRTRIFTGTGCNAKCQFCYYYNTGLKDYWSKDVIFQALRIAKKQRMEMIDFSGGEPTVHPNFLDLIKESVSLGFKIRGTLTNGIRFADANYVSKAVDAGLNEVLFSVHGSTPQEHDFITNVPNSFDKMMKSIQNIKDLGVRYRFNCTIFNKNYKNIDEHIKLYRKLLPYQINFILFNDFETASCLVEDLAVSYSEAAPYIKKAIDGLSDVVPSINVRYMPFCFMQGYEKHLTNYQQLCYDPFDWSLRMLVRLPATKVCSWSQYWIRILYRILKNKRFYGLSGNAQEKICLRHLLNINIKTEECKKCCYQEICSGLEPSYAKFIGSKELKACSGNIIKDPLHFRHEFYKPLNYP